jgi:hypothetical protein
VGLEGRKLFSPKQSTATHVAVDETKPWSLHGGRVAALGVLLCGRWFLIAFCSACGGNKMIEISRTKKE